MTTLAKAPTAADYQAIFDAERVKEYPVVDAFEARMGYAIDRAKLEAAARVLACPLKKSPPNWQHGRVLYALARTVAASNLPDPIRVLDIGTAKGFSAICLHWAMVDGGRPSAEVMSVDVIDPCARVQRNTVAEVKGLKTLAEVLGTFMYPEFVIKTEKRTGIDALKSSEERIALCFVDGKHTGGIVAEEGRLLAKRQQPGDLVMFDDVHLDDVNKAVISLSDLYELETLRILPNRAYAIGVRRG